MSQHFKKDWTPRQDSGVSPARRAQTRRAFLALSAGALVALGVGVALAQAPSKNDAAATNGDAPGNSNAASTPDAPNDPRAAQLAVDPDAQTEWNYKNNG